MKVRPEYMLLDPKNREQAGNEQEFIRQRQAW